MHLVLLVTTRVLFKIWASAKFSKPIWISANLSKKIAEACPKLQKICPNVLIKFARNKKTLPKCRRNLAQTLLKLKRR